MVDSVLARTWAREVIPGPQSSDTGPESGRAFGYLAAKTVADTRMPEVGELVD